LRRFPWALRLVSGAHPLGLPAGYLIRQLVLASDIFQNAKRKATEWFHDPLSLGETCRAEEVRRPKPLLASPIQFATAAIFLPLTSINATASASMQAVLISRGGGQWTIRSSPKLSTYSIIIA
jgi:hypothetical protein